MFDSLWPLGLQLARLLCPWDSPGKNTGVGCHFLLQGIFLTQESNPGLLHCRWILYHLSHQGSPSIQESSIIFIHPEKHILCTFSELDWMHSNPTIIWLSRRVLRKIQLTIKIRRKKGILLKPNRVISRKKILDKALRTVPPVKSWRHSHIHFWDKGSYIKMTYCYFI